MALLSGNGSALNPNAPIFVPASFRQVEDFSPAWWDLVKSSAWFRHFWLTLHQDDDYFDGDDDEIASQEPEDIIADEFANLEAEFEELVFSEAKSESLKSPAKNETDVDVRAVLENLGVTVRGSPPKGRGSKSAARFCSKAAPCLKVKFGPGWRIQQPR